VPNLYWEFTFIVGGGGSFAEYVFMPGKNRIFVALRGRSVMQA
jgi:hypothetical protein